VLSSGVVVGSLTELKFDAPLKLVVGHLTKLKSKGLVTTTWYRFVKSALETKGRSDTFLGINTSRALCAYVFVYSYFIKYYNMLLTLDQSCGKVSMM
jgi:hypothetical protein